MELAAKDYFSNIKEDLAGLEDIASFAAAVGIPDAALIDEGLKVLIVLSSGLGGLGLTLPGAYLVPGSPEYDAQAALDYQRAQGSHHR